jgi:hypothetical protein
MAGHSMAINFESAYWRGRVFESFSMAMASLAFAQGNVFGSPPFYIAMFPSYFILNYF